MAEKALVVIDGFALAVDRRYQAETHMWVLELGAGRVRIGMDVLGIETSGTLAQLSFEPAGTELIADRPFGQLEAAKFVGPLLSPVTGTVVTLNHAVIKNAGLIERDPYGEGWLIEAALAEGSAGLEALIFDPADLRAWFAAKIAGYRLRGVIAE